MGAAQAAPNEAAVRACGHGLTAQVPAKRPAGRGGRSRRPSSRPLCPEPGSFLALVSRRSRGREEGNCPTFSHHAQSLPSEACLWAPAPHPQVGGGGAEPRGLHPLPQRPREQEEGRGAGFAPVLGFHLRVQPQWDPPPTQRDGVLRLCPGRCSGSTQDTVTLGTQDGGAQSPGLVTSGKETGTAAGRGEPRVFPVLRSGTETSCFLFRALRPLHPLCRPPDSTVLLPCGPGLSGGCSSPAGFLGAGAQEQPLARRSDPGPRQGFCRTSSSSRATAPRARR